MKYEDEMILVGKRLLRAIRKEIQQEVINRQGLDNILIIHDEWEKKFPMRYWISFNEEAYFTHILKWLEMELPTEFSTYIPYPKNRIMFIA